MTYEEKLYDKIIVAGACAETEAYKIKHLEKFVSAPQIAIWKSALRRYRKREKDLRAELKAYRAKMQSLETISQQPKT